mmetsp:Transcript_30370/g.98744  ORF Transcript_30370/g.98744 Transcript_30370/m.98744 type:complete len:257 (+) Transcript_30370:3147-3917(+)
MMRSRLRSVTWMRRSRQKRAVSSSSTADAAPPALAAAPAAAVPPGPPAAHTSALASSKRDCASRNFESAKISSMRHFSMQRIVRSIASISLSVGGADVDASPSSERSDEKPELSPRRRDPEVESRRAAARAACEASEGRHVSTPSTPSACVTLDGKSPSLCSRSMQSRRLHQPLRSVSPYLLAMEKAVTAAILALVSSPKATLGRTLGPAVGLSKAVNLQSEAMRLSMTSSRRWYAAMRPTDKKPSSASRRTDSSL